MKYRMKTLHKIFLFLFFAGLIGFSSCTTESDPEGDITFWIDLSQIGGVDVFLDDSYVGNIKEAFPTVDPECNEPNTLTITRAAGTYTWRAATPNGQKEWPDKSVTVIANTCVDVLIAN